MNKKTDERESIYHFEIIDNYEKLKEVVENLDDHELSYSLKLISNNNLEDQIKVSEALTKLLNFTEKYNEILNNLNIYNNTEKCNELCKESMEQLQKQSSNYKKTISAVEVRCNDIQVNQQNPIAKKALDCNDKISNLIKKINLNIELNKPVDENLAEKLKQAEKELDKFYNDLDDKKNKMDILRGKIKEKKSIFNFFSGKNKVSLTETEQLIVDSKQKFENSEFKEFELKYNSLIVKNNSRLEQAKKSLGSNIIELNSDFLENLNNDSYLNAIYQVRLFGSIKKNCNKESIKVNAIDFNEIKVQNPNINLIEYLSTKIQKRNKDNYNNFIATSLDDVMFMKNTHVEKLNNNVNYKVKQELNNCKSITYASGMLFSGLAKISKWILPDPIVKPIEMLSKVLKDSAKVYNKELAELPDENKSIISSTKIIDEMFDKFSFNIKNKDDYENYINKFDKVKRINIHKQKDVLEIC